MKFLPNILSILRLVLVFFFYCLEPLSISFFVLYGVCGLTDILDGYIARKTKTESKTGAILDSLADFVMFIIILIILWPLINPGIIIIYFVLLIAFVKILAMIILYYRFGTAIFLHTYANKCIGFVLFLFPFFMFFLNYNILILILCSFAFLTAVEELLINIFSENLNLNIKSIFCLWRKK